MIFDASLLFHNRIGAIMETVAAKLAEAFYMCLNLWYVHLSSTWEQIQLHSHLIKVTCVLKYWVLHYCEFPQDWIQFWCDSLTARLAVLGVFNVYKCSELIHVNWLGYWFTSERIWKAGFCFSALIFQHQVCASFWSLNQFLNLI